MPPGQRSCAARPPRSRPIASRSSSASASSAACSSAGMVRSSRHIFQQTHSSRMPPATSRPTMAQKPRRDAGEEDAQHRRCDDADEDRLVALLARQPRRRQADHDGVVAGEHEVDEDDLKERAHGLARQELAHAAPLARVERGGGRCVPYAGIGTGNGWATLWSSSPTSQPQSAVRGARPGAASLAEIGAALNQPCRPATPPGRSTRPSGQACGLLGGCVPMIGAGAAGGWIVTAGA